MTTRIHTNNIITKTEGKAKQLCVKMVDWCCCWDVGCCLESCCHNHKPTRTFRTVQWHSKWHSSGTQNVLVAGDPCLPNTHMHQRRYVTQAFFACHALLLLEHGNHSAVPTRPLYSCYMLSLTNSHSPKQTSFQQHTTHGGTAGHGCLASTTSPTKQRQHPLRQAINMPQKHAST